MKVPVLLKSHGYKIHEQRQNWIQAARPDPDHKPVEITLLIRELEGGVWSMMAAFFAPGGDYQPLTEFPFLFGSSPEFADAITRLDLLITNHPYQAPEVTDDTHQAT